MSIFVCPECHGELDDLDASLKCAGCGVEYPMVDRVPVLLHNRSVFSAESVVQRSGTYFARRATESSRRQRIRGRLPMVSDYSGEDSARAAFVDNLTSARTALVVGAGYRRWNEVAPWVDWITTDVDLSYGVDAVADVTSIPLPDASVEAVVADNVLEHVVDIVQAAREIERVLRPGGVLYACIPFCLAVHGEPFDFFRVTPNGMRALFPGTEVVHLGAGAGPWSAIGALLAGRAAHTPRRGLARRAGFVGGRVAFSPIKYLDRIARDSYAPATVVYVGRRTEHTRTPAEVMDELRAR